jgi:hypothetical protein
VPLIQVLRCFRGNGGNSVPYRPLIPSLPHRSPPGPVSGNGPPAWRRLRDERLGFSGSQAGGRRVTETRQSIKERGPRRDPAAASSGEDPFRSGPDRGGRITQNPICAPEAGWPRQSRKAKMLSRVGYGPVTLPWKAARNLALSRLAAGSWPG